MRTLKTLVIAALVLSMAGVAVAELQNVEVGGKLKIRGNYYRMDYFGATSAVEQRTMLNVKADFTNDVSTFIEFDSYNFWGNDFRSDYLTGIDGRNGTDVDLYQAYINVKNLWGTPLSLRVGRQELVFGSEFLLGNNDSNAYFTGLSFDAIRLTFANDMFKADAFAAKLAETYQNFGKGDTDLYGVYGSYIGIEDVTIDAYWLYLVDNRVVGNEIDFHTFGLRGAGTFSGFDFDVEAAYQFGNVDGQPSACPFGFGEADVEYDAWAANLVAGYTFDMTWQPRVYGKFAYLGGGDRDESCWSNDRSLPFNRLFSDVDYSVFLEQQLQPDQPAVLQPGRSGYADRMHLPAAHGRLPRRRKDLRRRVRPGLGSRRVRHLPLQRRPGLQRRLLALLRRRLGCDGRLPGLRLGRRQVRRLRLLLGADRNRLLILHKQPEFRPPAGNRGGFLLGAPPPEKDTPPPLQKTEKSTIITTEVR